MLKITNNTDRVITLDDNLNLNPYQEIKIQSIMTPKIAQLKHMGIIDVKEMTSSEYSIEQKKELMSVNKKRRNETMEQIKAGNILPTVDLAHTATGTLNDLFVEPVTIKPKRGRNNKK